MSLLLSAFFPQNLPDPSTLTLSDLKTQVLPPFESILPVFKYTPPLSSLLSQYKYRFATSLSSYMAQAMAQVLKLKYKNVLTYWQTNHFQLVPIPLHPLKQNFRGFNQTSLLAQELAPLLHLNYLPRILVRTQFQSPQARLKSRQQRQTHLHHPFRLVQPQFGNYLIFDDVTTTTTTLRQAGDLFTPYCLKPLWGLTLAG